MTEPTEDELRLARDIAIRTWDLTGENAETVRRGEWDNIRQVRSALAAIRETTERAAKMINEGGYYDDDVSAFASTEIVEDLRNGKHLKGDHP